MHARAQLMFYSLSLLCGDVPVAAAVVVCRFQCPSTSRESGIGPQALDHAIRRKAKPRKRGVASLVDASFTAFLHVSQNMI